MDEKLGRRSLTSPACGAARLCYRVGRWYPDLVLLPLILTAAITWAGMAENSGKSGWSACWPVGPQFLGFLELGHRPRAVAQQVLREPLPVWVPELGLLLFHASPARPRPGACRGRPGTVPGRLPRSRRWSSSPCKRSGRPGRSPRSCSASACRHGAQCRPGRPPRCPGRSQPPPAAVWRTPACARSCRGEGRSRPGEPPGCR